MKILFLDIETSPILCYTWGTFKQDISLEQIIEPTKMLCWAAKWPGKKVRWGRSPEGIHEMICKSDAICTYYGKNFDMPHLNREFIIAGLSPPPPLPHIDLKHIVARTFLMASNKLAFVGPYLGVGEKIKNAGWSLWKSCLDGDSDAWEKMRKYNEQDVVLLEKLHAKVLPWIDNHPNHNLYTPSAQPKCPNCGSDHLIRRGFQKALTLEYVRLQCQACGKWSRERKSSGAKSSVR